MSSGPRAPDQRKSDIGPKGSSTNSPLPMFFLSIWFPWGPVLGAGRASKSTDLYSLANKVLNFRMAKKRALSHGWGTTAWDLWRPNIFRNPTPRLILRGRCWLRLLPKCSFIGWKSRRGCTLRTCQCFPFNFKLRVAMSCFRDWDWEIPLLSGFGFFFLFFALFCLKFYTALWYFSCSPLGLKQSCDSAGQRASLSHPYFLGFSAGDPWLKLTKRKQLRAGEECGRSDLLRA